MAREPALWFFGLLSPADCIHGARERVVQRALAHMPWTPPVTIALLADYAPTGSRGTLADFRVVILRRLHERRLASLSIADYTLMWIAVSPST